MDKDDLKSLITQIYNDILQKIDSTDAPTKETAVGELQKALTLLHTIPEAEIDKLGEAQVSLADSYKELAKKSLNSYKETNKTLEEITEQHKETLSSCKNELIDYPSIQKQFDALHDSMSKEIEKANTMITQLSQEVKQLEKDSQLDALTKVFNRRALDTYLEKICKKGKLNHKLYLLILDVDKFKQINDTHGHLAGDKLLIYITKLLRKTLRDGDKLFRYGGDEFVIILNRIEDDVCINIAHRILELVRSNRLIYKGKALHVTISIGVTRYEEGDTPSSIIERADRTLYKSKNSGKNQINVELNNGN